MKQCKCGGIVRQHALTNGREAWTCGCCQRYEIVKVAQTEDDQPPTFDKVLPVTNKPEQTVALS